MLRMLLLFLLFGPSGQESTKLLEQGQQELRSGRTAEAVELFRQAVGRDPRSALAHFWLGYAYRLSGNYEMVGEAKAELRQALELDPRMTSASFFLAQMYLEIGQLRRAREELESALAIQPSAPELRALLGETHRRLGDAESARRHSLEALQENPSLAAAHYFLGLALLDLGRSEEAIGELAQAASSEQANFDMVLALASAYQSSGRWQEAAETYQRAARIDPARLEPLLGLAKGHRAAGREAQALVILKDLLKREFPQLSSTYFQEMAAAIHCEIGRVHGQAGRGDAALDSFRESLKVDPEFGESHQELARLLHQRGDYQAAMEHASSAARLGRPVEAGLWEDLQSRTGQGKK